MDDPVDPRELRISDGDRHRVAELLREAAGDGRIDLEELDQRLEATYAAKTYGDLVPITLDLPAHTDPSPLVRRPSAAATNRAAAGTEPTYAFSVGIFGETKRVGAWDVGNVHTATSVMGAVVIDLREARFPQGDVVINANAVMGSVEVIVNAQTRVRVEGFGIMGSYTEGRTKVPAETDRESPLVRVRGLALMGSVEVRRKGPPGERSRRLLGHE
ncbi:MAG: DUF1707 domain-containing protein [Marmoricola sp.]